MTNNRDLFTQELNQLLRDPNVQQMKKYAQHGGTNTLSHSTKVALASFDLAEKLGWKINEEELARGAILHDYYLYKIKEQGLSAYRHGTSHPGIAVRNAHKDFGLSEKEMKDIRSHMWPLTFRHPPRSKEAALLCLADKDIAIREFARPEVQRAGRAVRKLKNRRQQRK